MPEALIKTFCPPKGIVLDPFSGSGTTLLAAKQLGRTFYGFDLEQEYVDLARKRLAAENGKRGRRKQKVGLAPAKVGLGFSGA